MIQKIEKTQTAEEEEQSSINQKIAKAFAVYQQEEFEKKKALINSSNFFKKTVDSFGHLAVSYIHVQAKEIFDDMYEDFWGHPKRRRLIQYVYSAFTTQEFSSMFSRLLDGESNFQFGPLLRCNLSFREAVTDKDCKNIDVLDMFKEKTYPEFLKEYLTEARDSIDFGAGMLEILGSYEKANILPITSEEFFKKFESYREKLQASMLQ